MSCNNVEDCNDDAIRPSEEQQEEDTSAAEVRENDLEASSNERMGTSESEESESPRPRLELEKSLESATSTASNIECLSISQTLIVGKLIKKIALLRTENILLEQRISDSDKQNKVLQLQIDIMMKKMELLEEFMAQVKKMEADGAPPPTSTPNQENSSKICTKCKKSISQQSPEDDPCSDSEDMNELMQMWGANSGEDENNFQNPLLVDVVVGNVMKFLSIPTLLKCRLVNDLWYKEATYVLKRRRTLLIARENIDRLSTLLKLHSTTGSEEEENEETSSSSARNFFCHKVKLDIGFLVKTYRDILENFFKKFGSEISHYSIHCEQENSSLLYTEEFRNVLLPSVKNIKVLEISVPTKITERETIYDEIRPKRFLYDCLRVLKLRQMDASLDIGGYSIATVKELLLMAPNLKSLWIETHTREVVTRILEAMHQKEIRGIVHQLTELYLDAFITEQHLTLLLPLDFKLTALQLSYFTVNVSSAMLEALLCKQRTTLQTLIVGDYQKRTTANSNPLIIKLPVMRELRNLKFVDPLFPDHRQIIFNPLNYSEQLPSLEGLSFEHDIGKPVGPHYFQDMFVCSPSPCLTLKSLRISHGVGLGEQSQLVAAAAKMLPNLVTLELASASDAVIQMVWKEFTWIKSLSLTLHPANLNIDSLMTGIPDQVCRRIQEKNLFAQVDIMSALEIIRTEASICGLIELESLRIDGLTSSLMTAVTGYLALVHMKKLTNISIKADIITLSRECRRVLGEKLHLNLFEMF